MASKSYLNEFNEIYEKTYSDILKFIIIRCHNISDTNDIIQETYLELWKILNKKELNDSNIKSYLIGIATNKIKKHYTIIQKLKALSLFDKNEEDIELINTIKDDFDIESLIIKDDDWNKIWKYIKQKKNQDIPKIFYLHYKLGLTIKEISLELKVSESSIKNSIYRTLKELQDNFGNGGK